MRKIYFWQLERASNRGEYYLRLQDRRLNKMYKDGIIIIIVHSYKTKWLRRTKYIIEVQPSHKEGMRRSLELDTDGAVYSKPAKSEKFNRGIYMPCTCTMLMYRFQEGVPLPKFVFFKPKQAARFLEQLNDATLQFIEDNTEQWTNINR